MDNGEPVGPFAITGFTCSCGIWTAFTTPLTDPERIVFQCCGCQKKYELVVTDD